MIRDLACCALVACVLGAAAGYTGEGLRDGGGNPAAQAWVLGAEGGAERVLLQVDSLFREWASRL